MDQGLLALAGTGWSLGLSKEETNSLLPCPTSSPQPPDSIPSAGVVVSHSSAWAALETIHWYLRSASQGKTPSPRFFFL